MGEAENEFIDYSIDSDSPANKIQLGVIRIVEDEMVSVEMRQVFSTNATCNGWYVVDVWLLDHGRHRLLHGALTKFELGVLVPYRFYIKVRTTDQWFEEGETPGMSDGCRRALEIVVSWDREERLQVRILVRPRPRLTNWRLRLDSSEV